MTRVRAGSQNLPLSRHILSTPHSDCRRQLSRRPDQILPGQHLHQTHGGRSNHENAARGSKHVLLPPTCTHSDGLLWAPAPAMVRAIATRPPVSGCVPVPHWGREGRPPGLAAAGSACGCCVDHPECLCHVFFRYAHSCDNFLSAFSFMNSLVQNKHIGLHSREPAAPPQSQAALASLHTGQP